MKKYLIAMALLLSGVMTIGLTGCGNADERKKEGQKELEDLGIDDLEIDVPTTPTNKENGK